MFLYNKSKGELYMCVFLDNDMVLGNLFIKLIERNIDEIAFEKLYDFIYYVSSKLNETENATVLVSRDGIMKFAEYYADYIEIDETFSKIIITRSEESLICFKKRYEDNGKEFSASFDYALNKVAA